MPLQNFDVILVHSKLDESCYELAAYIDAYLQDIHMDPVIDPKVWHAVDQATTAQGPVIDRADSGESSFSSESDMLASGGVDGTARVSLYESYGM